MTTPDILIQWANCMKELEATKAENLALRAELEAVKREVPTEQQQFFSTEEAGKFLGKKPSFLRNNRHLIPYRKDGHRTVIYNREDLIKYAESNKTKCRLPKGDTDK